MTNLMKFHSADLPALIERINKYSIGMDDYFERLGSLHETTSNYPPYNLVQVSNVEYRLSLIHISEPTRRYAISYAVFCLKKKTH